MSWALILIFYGTGITLMPMPSQPMCEAAAAEVRAAVQRDTRPFPPNFTTACVRTEP